MKCTNTAFTIIILAFITYLPGNSFGQKAPRFLVGNSITLIDGTLYPYTDVRPGDTIFIQSGTRDNLLIRNFHGAPGDPVVIINYGGPVIINTTYSYGIAIKGSRYIRFTGAGDASHYYGFNFRHANGAGLSLDGMTSDCEVDHISIEGSPIAGLYAKTDPDCSFTDTRDKFTQYNTLIHDNYIDSIGNEGLYIGSTKYSGVIVNCNGKDTLIYPSLLSGVRVYDNIVKYSGWDGIQVSSAASDCQVFNNIVMYDSQGETESQMSGIILGGGSKCDCYNNSISDGKGDGIEIHGLGGSRIFNNIIVDPGLSYAPNDPSKKKYGIYVSDISVESDSSFYLLFNDIISPKSEGIHFASSNSRNNLIVSNVVIHPGNTGVYVTTTNPDNVHISDNYFAVDSTGAGFIPGSYDLKPGSPLIDAGYYDNRNITFDFLNRHRPSGAGFDIGAYEYQFAASGIGTEATSSGPFVRAYPNPVMENLTFKFESEQPSDFSLDIYTMTGEQLSHMQQNSLPAGDHIIAVNTGFLAAGIYIYSLRLGSKVSSGKFIRVK